MDAMVYYGIISLMQFGLCFLPGRWLRLLLPTLSAGFSVLCGAVYGLSVFFSREDTLGFPAGLLAVFGMICLLAEALGWGLYGFIQFVQKRRK